MRERMGLAITKGVPFKDGTIHVHGCLPSRTYTAPERRGQSPETVQCIVGVIEGEDAEPHRTGDKQVRPDPVAVQVVSVSLPRERLGRRGIGWA